MKLLRKVMIVLTVLFLSAVITNSALAHCGSCAAGEKKEASETDKHAACVKCSHAKVCKEKTCQDPAHKAECTCLKKKEEAK